MKKLLPHLLLALLVVGCDLLNQDEIDEKGTMIDSLLEE